MSLTAHDAPTLALASAQPHAREHRWAVGTVLVSACIFFALTPFAKLPLSPSPAFIPIYETAVVLTDLITAVLLFGQFRVVQERGLLVLGAGYLFTASIAALHMLSFPGLFAQSGVLGGGMQTTAWIYMIWHGGFPLFVLVYASMKDRNGAPAELSASQAVPLSAAAALILAGSAGILTTQGHDLLPEIMRGQHYTQTMHIVITTVWGLSLLALAGLWRRRPHSVLDLWLMVVLCAWIFDIALSAVLNAGRFDLGFYAGRIYGLLAVSFVLMILLLENGLLYASLAKTHAELQRLSVADPLTGIGNRRAFESTLDSEWRRALRTGAPLSLLMIDVDHFKLFNDSRGHVAGDQCLREVAEAMSASLRRAGDFAGRYGGEEFAVILPNTPADAALAFAERLLQAIDQRAIPHSASPLTSHVTISIGSSTLCTQVSLGETTRSEPSLLVEAADSALYAAKRAGRHQVYGNVLDVAITAAR